MSKIKDFASDTKKKLLKEAAEECKEMEESNNLYWQGEKLRKKEEKFFLRVNFVLSKLAKNNEDLIPYLIKMAGMTENGCNNNLSIILFSRQYGKHRTWTSSGSCGAGNDPGDGCVSSKTVKSVYVIWLSFFKPGYGKEDWKLEVQIQRNGTGSMALFPDPVLKQYAVPEKIRQEMLAIFKLLSNPKSALRFFEKNHEHLLKLNRERRS